MVVLWAGGCAVCGGALLSKSVTASLPAVVLVIVWWRHGRVRRGDVVPLLPLFAIGLASGVLTIWMERTYVGRGGVSTVDDRSAVDRRARGVVLRGEAGVAATADFLLPAMERERDRSLAVFCTRPRRWR